MPRLEADLEAVHAELKNERMARVGAERQAAVLAAEKASLDASLNESKSNGQLLGEQLARARDRIDELATGALAGARAQFAQRSEATQAQLDQARIDAKAAIEAAAELRSRLG